MNARESQVVPKSIHGFMDDGQREKTQERMEYYLCG